MGIVLMIKARFLLAGPERFFGMLAVSDIAHEGVKTPGIGQFERGYSQLYRELLAASPQKPSPFQ